MKKMMFLTLALLVAAMGSASAANGSKSEAHGPKKVFVNVAAHPKVKCDVAFGAECHNHRFDCPKCDRAKGPKCNHKAPAPHHGAKAERGKHPHKRGEFRPSPNGGFRPKVHRF